MHVIYYVSTKKIKAQNVSVNFYVYLRKRQLNR